MNTRDILAAVRAVHEALLANEMQIESLDRAIGDGDHFINVRRGCEAIAAMESELAPLVPAQAFQRIGMKLLSTIGGASGPLIGSFFIAMGRTLMECPHRTAASSRAPWPRAWMRSAAAARPTWARRPCWTS
jgi:dihydroxyacetone kinase-like protein